MSGWTDDDRHRHEGLPDDHAHRCDRCSTTWWHASFPGPWPTFKEHPDWVPAHTCPVPGCGGQSYG